MWYNTKVTELLGIDCPIMQGPFGGGLSSAELVQQYPTQADLADTELIL
jgi:NAD(P)H-dependent flavin oxidoreductase YrpB (nitropropane dioxygenase family)